MPEPKSPVEALSERIECLLARFDRSDWLLGHLRQRLESLENRICDLGATLAIEAEAETEAQDDAAPAVGWCVCGEEYLLRLTQRIAALQAELLRPPVVRSTVPPLVAHPRSRAAVAELLRGIATEIGGAAGNIERLDGPFAPRSRAVDPPAADDHDRSSQCDRDN